MGDGELGGGLQLSGGPIGGQGRSGKVQVGYDGRSTTKGCAVGGRSSPSRRASAGAGGCWASCGVEAPRADSLSNRPNRATEGLQLLRIWPSFVSSNVAARSAGRTHGYVDLRDALGLVDDATLTPRAVFLGLGMRLFLCSWLTFLALVSWLPRVALISGTSMSDWRWLRVSTQELVVMARVAGQITRRDTTRLGTRESLRLLLRSVGVAGIFEVPLPGL
jgi:hypothetical protein